MIKKICETCHSEFEVKTYRVNTARFCSMSCRSSWQAKEFLNKAPKTHLLGNKHRSGKRPANAFLSENVRGKEKPRWVEGVTRVCENCKIEFSKKPWIENKNGPSRFCSRDCFETSGVFVGDKSPCWVGGSLTYRGRGWKDARMEVVLDQEGKCDDCGKHVGDSLPVHHKIPFRLFSNTEDANVRSNLVGLCQSCHMKHEIKPDMFVEPPKVFKQEGLEL